MLSILLLVFSLSIDAFVVSLAYGTSKIKLSLLAKLIITAISSTLLVASVLLGSVISHFIPHQVTLGICVFLLVSLGFMRLLEHLVKQSLRRKPDHTHQINWHFLNIQWHLQTSLPEDPSPTTPEGHTLTPRESALLGLALSLDSVAVGIGIGLMSMSILEILTASILMNMVMLTLGNILGYQFAKKFDLNLGWLSGLILIALAFTKLT